jgi:hypothetical protein
MALDLEGAQAGGGGAPPAAAPTIILTPMGLIYGVDLTTKPAQNWPSGGGSAVVDGKTWWAKGPASWGPPYSSLIPGEGIEVSGGAWSGYQTYDWQGMFLPIAQLAGFNPDAPLALAFRFTGSGYSGGSYVVGGMRSCAQSSAKMQSSSSYSAIRFMGTDTNIYHENSGSSDVPPLTGMQPAVGDNLWLILRLMGRIYTPAHVPWTGALPDELPFGPQLVNFINPRLLAPQSATDVGFIYARNQSSYINARLTHVGVYQPRASI